MTDTLPEAEVEKAEVEQPSTERAHVSNTDRLSAIRNFMRPMDANVEVAETEKEIRGYLRAKLENARRERSFIQESRSSNIGNCMSSQPSVGLHTQ